MMSEIFVVYLYCDHRKEVDIQHLNVVQMRLNLPKKYSYIEERN